MPERIQREDKVRGCETWRVLRRRDILQEVTVCEDGEGRGRGLLREWRFMKVEEVERGCLRRGWAAREGKGSVRKPEELEENHGSERHGRWVCVRKVGRRLFLFFLWLHWILHHLS